MKKKKFLGFLSLVAVAFALSINFSNIEKADAGETLAYSEIDTPSFEVWICDGAGGGCAYGDGPRIHVEPK